MLAFTPRVFLTVAFREDDSKWPQKNKDGRQQLEIRLGNDHISFEVRNAFVKYFPNADCISDCEDWFVGRCYRVSRS